MASTVVRAKLVLRIAIKFPSLFDLKTNFETDGINRRFGPRYAGPLYASAPWLPSAATGSGGAFLR